MTREATELGDKGLSIIAYVDDIMLIGASKEEVEGFVRNIETAAKSIRLEMNEEKTVYGCRQKKGGYNQGTVTVSLNYEKVMEATYILMVGDHRKKQNGYSTLRSIVEEEGCVYTKIKIYYFHIPYNTSFDVAVW